MTATATYTHTAEDLAHHVIITTETQIGGTFSVYDGSQYNPAGHEHAFAVAEGRGTTQTFTFDRWDQEERNELFSIVVDAINAIRNEPAERYLGTWVNDGTWYVDIVDIVTD